MSIYYDKYDLNTYYGAPYFQAHIPADYPLHLVLQKSRAFRRLPPRLRELSVLAKRWVQHIDPIANDEQDQWYDDDGYELNPGTGRRLTDEEIDAEWDMLESRWGKPNVKIEDIPLPAGGFADPDTWEEPPKEEPVGVFMWGRFWPDPEDCLPTKAQLLNDIASRGREATADEYGIPIDQLPDCPERDAWEAAMSANEAGAGMGDC
jgi:hypothetical protein